MNQFEQNLGYTFTNEALLKQALTHPSALRPGQGVDFERLEFLGDRVLGIVVASWLFEEFPHENEGDLAKRFTNLVRKETLVEVAKAIDLDQAMSMKQERSSSQTKRLDTLLSDGCEALLGALYLDAGLEVARSFILKHWKDYHGVGEPPRDAKSILQEWVQSQGKSHPLYVVVESSGPAHAPSFVVEVQIEGAKSAQGKGSSKRLAEQDAAQHLLDMIAHD